MGPNYKRMISDLPISRLSSMTIELFGGRKNGGIVCKSIRMSRLKI